MRLLRCLGKRGRFTQQEVAARLNMTQTFVSKCERGERRLDIVELRAWCAAINTTMSEFVLRFDAACKSSV
ncbi:helix-turn-helix domain-containing protein [Chromobacterium amazonense]|uniref:helix-turn-helix domain-containing protein n=1 Tax=Chromobacterium amazonense TaxID=1382803 RepID=UPI003BEEFB2F